MSAIIGDETGLLKLIDESEDYQIKSFGSQSRIKGVLNLVKLSETKFGLIRKDGTLEYWDVDFQAEQQLSKFYTDVIDPCPLGLCSLKSGCDSKGIVVYNQNNEIKTFVNDIDFNLNKDNATIFESNGYISTMIACNECVCFGGKENDVTIFDTETQQIVWKSKNVPRDNLNLRVPIWITALDSLKNDEQSVSNGVNLISGTAYKQLRIYDSRSSPRPIKSFDVCDYPVTNVKSFGNRDYALVTDSVGSIYQYDLRTERKMFSFKSSGGSIRGISVSDDESRFLCVGLDRFARWHSIEQRERYGNIFLKNRANCCLLFQTSKKSFRPKRQREDIDIVDSFWAKSEIDQDVESEIDLDEL
jgi:ribosome biogenesis protein NSA1